jgi:penicillin-binding protein 1C
VIRYVRSWSQQRAAARRRRARALAERTLRVCGVVLAAVVAIATAAVWIVPLPATLAVAPSLVVLGHEPGGVDVPLFTFLSPDEKWRLPVDVADVDPRFVAALLAFEDARFPWHPGVDPLAIARAARSNAQAGAVVSGGSTIAMQLARILEPRPRTLGAKMIEAMRAVQLTARVGRDGVLRAYLERAPYGRNYEGVETASWALFRHSARSLSSGEIAVLLALPQRPNERAPSVAHIDVLRRARHDVAARVEAAGVAGFSLAEADAADVPTRFHALPRSAPHAASWIAEVSNSSARGARLRTTLDPTVQKIAERVMSEAHKDAERNGIADGAIVVVESETGAVRALVGGYDFFGTSNAAQIPAFAQPRATGSTLKPFLYAEAIDDGIALPETLVLDVPHAYGTYAPKNFDGGYDGVVRLEDALSRSLNLPFVALLDQLGTERFLGLLRMARVESLVDAPGHYGLSVAAGSLEMTPLELAGLFATLNAEGRAAPIHVLADGGADGSVQLFSPGAAWLTRRALSIRDRPDFPTRGRRQDELRRIHWKTGTSFGHRDAWAAGSAGAYTAVVWQGNLDRTGSVHLVGADAAAPLLFEVLESLADRDGARARDDEMPAELAPVEVCALSGRIPGPACAHTTIAFARASSVPRERCPFHDEVEIDDATGLAVRPGCRAGKATHTESVTRWPAAVRRYLHDRLRGADGFGTSAPSLHPDCASDEEAPPRIESPVAGLTTLLVPGLDAERQEVPLEATGRGTLSWYVDGVHVGDGTSAERLWWTPVVGTHSIVVMDAGGRRARTELEVRNAF